MREAKFRRDVELTNVSLGILPRDARYFTNAQPPDSASSTIFQLTSELDSATCGHLYVALSN